MRNWIAAAALAVALPASAHAEPKTITLDGCAGVATEIRTEASRQTMTVKCTGEANDPKVREGYITNYSTTSPLTLSPGRACANGAGSYVAC
jgi:hypothetical protein